jgi:hypothetical protein
MTRNIRRFIAAVLPIVAFALTSSAGMAQSYSGNWPMTVTKARQFNGTYCVTLTDDGSYGWPHSGEAELDGQNDPYPGYFTVIDGLITVTFPEPSGPGDCCSFLLFTARASDGHIGKGVFNYAGDVDYGVLAVGKNGGC